MPDKEEIEEQKEDFDFDFDIYEDEEKDEEVVESIEKKERPIVTGIRSRFSNGQAELERLADINVLVSQYSFKIASFTQDVNVLWKYYGLLDEFWESIRNIYGKAVNDEMSERKKICRELLNGVSKGGKIPHRVHNNLLYFRSMLYRLKQLGNLGFEVEKVNKGIYGKARRNIEDG